MNVRLFWYFLWHYRIPVYQLLGRKLHSTGHGSLCVEYCAVSKERSDYDVEQHVKDFCARKTKGFQLFNWRMLFALAPLQSAFRRNVDVMVLEWNTRNLMLVPATLLARVLGKRVVWWGHGAPKRHKRVFSRLHYFLGRNIPDAILLYGERERRLLAHRWHFAPEKIFVAPNAVDVAGYKSALDYCRNTPAFMESVRREYGIRPECHYLIYSGRLLPERDLERIIDAVEALRNRGADVGAIYVGEGEFRVQLEEEAKRRNLSEFVVFCGALYDLRNLAAVYECAEICVIPGWLGLSLTQAAAMEKPCVIADESSLHNPEIQQFVPNETGLMYAYHQNDLSERVEELLSDPARAKRLGKYGQRILEEQYTVERMVDGILRACCLTVRDQPTE